MRSTSRQTSLFLVCFGRRLWITEMLRRRTEQNLQLEGLSSDAFVLRDAAAWRRVHDRLLLLRESMNHRQRTLCRTQVPSWFLSFKRYPASDSWQRKYTMKSGNPVPRRCYAKLTAEQSVVPEESWLSESIWWGRLNLQSFWQRAWWSAKPKQIMDQIVAGTRFEASGVLRLWLFPTRRTMFLVPFYLIRYATWKH